jgi:hypothetical protein
MVRGDHDDAPRPTQPHGCFEVPSNLTEIAHDDGHFALDTAADEIAAVVHNFLRPAVPLPQKQRALK